jgi:glycosyltransferase involved in cell wall biosynthesis
MGSDFPVSVVIRTYNRAPMLGNALDTVLRQTLRPQEIIVVDDGSTDETPQLVESYQRRHAEIRYLRTEGNNGADRAARAGVEESGCRYVAFLDSDDLWLPHHLEHVAAAFAGNPGSVMVFSRYGLVNAGCKALVDLVSEPRLSEPPLRQLLLKKIIVQPTRTVFLRQAILDVGGVPLFPAAEDWVLAVLLAARFPKGLVQMSRRTVFFRLHGSQSYSRPVQVRKALLDASEYLLGQVPPEFRTLKQRVISTNLLHCAVFLWQAGELGEGWQSLVRALAIRPSSVATKEFWMALGRLVIPPSFGRLVRRGKYALQERRGERSPAAAATNTV